MQILLYWKEKLLYTSVDASLNILMFLTKGVFVKVQSRCKHLLDINPSYVYFRLMVSAPIQVGALLLVITFILWNLGASMV